jgi:hypothetical protein
MFSQADIQLGLGVAARSFLSTSGMLFFRKKPRLEEVEKSRRRERF